MTTPPDPFSTPPQGQPPSYDGPPSYGGAPAYGTPPPYGTPEPPAYGAQPGYGQPQYGQQQYAQQQYGQPFGAPVSPFGVPGGPQLAGWGSRVGASLLDGLIVSVVYYVPLLLGVLSGSDAAAALLAAVGLLGGLAFSIWNYVRQGRTGQTIGKGVTGIKVLREQDGQVLGAGLSIGRAFTHILDAIPCYLGFLWPLWDAKKQTFADKILNTVVVKA